MPKRPCIEHGCPEYAAEGKPRCLPHHREFERKRWDRGATGRRGSRKGWRERRRKVWMAQGERCGHCHWPVKDFWLHHKNGDAKDDRPSNLIGLCADCHNKAEGRKVSVKRQMTIDECIDVATTGSDGHPPTRRASK